MRTQGFIAVAALVSLLGCANDSAQPARLRLATTTSTRDSGLLDELLPNFEKDYDVRVDVIAVGTGKALKLGEAGDVDVVLVHARDAEDAFMAAGHGGRREDVMHNAFEIVGPADDPARIRGVAPAEALERIAASTARFVSRGDDSGTHKRERALWESAGVQPAWNDYIETGQGMGATLTIASEMQAYALVDRGTRLQFRDKIELAPLVTSGAELRNPYGVIVVNGEKHPDIHTKLAEAFVDFLIAPETQRRIAEFRIDDEPLFYPRRVPTTASREPAGR